MKGIAPSEYQQSRLANCGTALCQHTSIVPYVSRICLERGR